MAADILVCRKCKHQECLVEVLTARSDARIEMVRCQKICHGPVVGLRVGGRFEWFERVDRLKPLAALLRITGKGEVTKLPKALRKQWVKRHSGRAPRT